METLGIIILAWLGISVALTFTMLAATLIRVMVEDRRWLRKGK